MAVRRHGVVVTWPTFALLVDKEQGRVKSRGRGAHLAFRVDGHDAMASLAFAHALVEAGHWRGRLLLVQALVLRPPHLDGGELIFHGCWLMSVWIQGSVALARPPRGGGTFVIDPAGIGLGNGLAGLSMPIRSMPRAPSMRLVGHELAAAAKYLYSCPQKNGPGRTKGDLTADFPVRALTPRLLAKLQKPEFVFRPFSCHIYLVGDTRPGLGRVTQFLRNILNPRNPNMEISQEISFPSPVHPRASTCYLTDTRQVCVIRSLFGVASLSG